MSHRQKKHEDRNSTGPGTPIYDQAKDALTTGGVSRHHTKKALYQLEHNGFSAYERYVTDELADKAAQILGAEQALAS